MQKEFGYPNERILEKAEKGILRKKLYLTHTTGVENHEAGVIFSGIAKLVEEIRSGVQLINYGNRHENTADGKFENPDWYQNQAMTNRNMGFGQQVDGSALLTLLSQEPWQQYEPHMDVMVCDRDMTGFDAQSGRYANFAYGITRYPNFVTSVMRFRHRIKDPDLSQAALAISAAHELAHNFNLVNRNFNWINELGIHCNGESGPCLMEQVDVSGRRTIEEQARLLIGRQRWLCSDCLEEANFRKDLLEGHDLW